MYTRRDFIKSIVRKTALATLALGSAHLAFREKTDDNCNFDLVCKNCKKLEKCQLPEAKDHKTRL